MMKTTDFRHKRFTQTRTEAALMCQGQAACHNGMLLGFSKIHTAKCFRVPNVLSLRHLIREDDLSVFRRGFCSIFRNVGKKSTLNCEATKTEIIQIGKS